MTKEDIIRMAREAGLDPDLWNYTDAFERFAALVSAAEREACAKLCEQRTTYSMPIPCPDGIEGCCVAHFVPGSRSKTSQECATEIRARRKK